MSSRISTIVWCLCFVASSLASTYVVHEKRDGRLPDHLRPQRIEPDALLPMRIGLMQNEQAQRKAVEWLMDVSHPDSPNYGRHWSSSQVIEAFQPSEDTVRNVTAWLSEHGILDFTHTDNKMWFAFDLEVAKAEAMLQAEFYEHVTHRGDFHASCDSYHLPEHLRPHIHLVTPGVKSRSVAGRTKRSRKLRKREIQVLRSVTQVSTSKETFTRATTSQAHTTATRSSPPKSSGPSGPPPVRPPPGFSLDSLKHCDVYATPSCIRALYNLTAPDPKLPVSLNNSLGMFETEYDFYTQEYLNDFYRYLAPEIPDGTSPIFYPIDGTSYPPTPQNVTKHGMPYLGPESNLYVEVALPIVYPQNITVFEVEGNENGFVRDQALLYDLLLDAIDGSYCTKEQREAGSKGKLQCGTLKPTNVISASWFGDELLTPASYFERACNEFLKLGMQGVSLVFLSGDQGSGQDMLIPDETCANKTSTRLFLPNWQGGCPWVTAVGGTEIVPGHSVNSSEAWTDTVPRKYPGASSGGGFDLYNNAPSYQKDALASYFKNHDPPFPYFTNGNYNDTKGRYNRNGRGVPDISALAVNITIEYGGFSNGGGGTSSATPICAALFNRIVEERIRIGKGRLGFLNPVLYQHPEALNDIVGGNNYACSGQDDGFKAVPGWDPVTGLGMPNYGKLLDIFLKLP